MTHRFRFFLVLMGLIGSFSYLGFHLYALQVEKGSYYSAKAESQYQLAGLLEPHRGNIYFTDKNKNAIPAAVNKSYPVIFAVPQEITDGAAAAASLAPIINLDKEKIKSLLQKKSQYEILIKKADEEQTAAVSKINLKGIYLDSQETRHYPFAGLAANLLGFVGPSDNDAGMIGKYGVEAFYENQLAGVPGTVKNNKIKKAVSGKDLLLNIDRDIQTKAEEILSQIIERFAASGGGVIVQEIKTGRIIALGSRPSFDPNNYSKANIAHFLNPIVQEEYEPGSVFKVITMAAAIDSGAVTPETTYYDNGVLEIKDRKIRNWDLQAHGKTTMTGVIEHSLNVGAAFAEKKTGHKTFYDYVQQFGFGQPTQINLPGELSGNLKNLTDFNNDVYYATASFGQGITVTPIQLINAVSAIANSGRLMRPIIVADQEPEELTAVISAETARQITAMMESALEKAEVSKIDKYRLAGKTGTAQMPDLKHGGYTKDVINTYVGFGPVSDPQFTILFQLKKPAGAPLAGQTVVPAFRELAQFILNYYNIPPDK